MLFDAVCALYISNSTWMLFALAVHNFRTPNNRKTEYFWRRSEEEEEECRSMRHIHRHMILIATNRDNMQYKERKTNWRSHRTD